MGVVSRHHGVGHGGVVGVCSGGGCVVKVVRVVNGWLQALTYKVTLLWVAVIFVFTTAMYLNAQQIDRIERNQVVSCQGGNRLRADTRALARDLGADADTLAKVDRAFRERDCSDLGELPER